MIAQETQHTTQGQQVAAPGPSNPAAEQKAIAPRAQSALIQTGKRGLDLATYEDVWRFASTVAQSGLAPKGLQTPAAIFAATVYGMELGIPGMTSVTNTAVINGRPSFYGPIVTGIVRASGQLERLEEWWELGGKRVERVPAVLDDTLTAVCEVKRLGCKAVVSTFSVAQAKRAGLWEKDGPWRQYPERMLRHRARSFALNDEFGDILKGVRTDEEAADMVTLDPKDVTVETVNPPASAEAVAATRAREVRIEQARAATVEAARPAKARPPIAPGPVAMTAARNVDPAAKPPVDVQATVEPAPVQPAPVDPQPVTNTDSAPPQETRQKTMPEMLAEVFAEKSMTFADFIGGLRAANWLKDGVNWTSWADIPETEARRLFNSRHGLLQWAAKARASTVKVD